MAKNVYVNLIYIFRHFLCWNMYLPTYMCERKYQYPILHMKEYAAKKQLHSETFLKYVIKSAKKINIRFNRIRANGEIWKDCS